MPTAYASCPECDWDYELSWTYGHYDGENSDVREELDKHIKEKHNV